MARVQGVGYSSSAEKCMLFMANGRNREESFEVLKVAMAKKLALTEPDNKVIILIYIVM